MSTVYKSGTKNENVSVFTGEAPLLNGNSSEQVD